VAAYSDNAIGSKVGRPALCLLVACLVLALAACGGNSNNQTAASGKKKQATSPKESPSSEGGEEETTTKTIGGQKINFKKAANVGSQSSVEVEADNFYFSPTVLKGKAGQTITLELKNEGSATHNFTLESQHVDQDLAVGQSAKVKVTFPKSGTLLFHCKFHQALGMQGALQVSS
jgi:plastocyanin